MSAGFYSHVVLGGVNFVLAVLCLVDLQARIKSFAEGVPRPTGLSYSTPRYPRTSAPLCRAIAAPPLRLRSPLPIAASHRPLRQITNAPYPPSLSHGDLLYPFVQVLRLLDIFFGVGASVLSRSGLRDTVFATAVVVGNGGRWLAVGGWWLVREFQLNAVWTSNAPRRRERLVVICDLKIVCC